MEIWRCFMELVISRIDDWYIKQSSELDPYYLSNSILEKLSTRQKKGLIYDKLKIINMIKSKQNLQVIESFDKAIIMLVCKGLITRIKVSDFRSDLFITDLGLKTLKAIKERMHEIN